MKSAVLVGAVIAASSYSSVASSINIAQSGFTGVSGIVVSGRTSSSGVSGGHIGFIYGFGGSAGTGAKGQFQGPQGSRFVSFCIELGQNTNGGQNQYDLVDLAAAPNPASGAPGGTPYGAATAQLINNVVGQAIAWNWIAEDLDVDTGSTNVRLAAVQAAIWAAVYGTGNMSFVGNSLVNDSNAESVQSAYNSLIASLNTNRTVDGMIAIVNSGFQDQLYVVPLPPAAFAGLATLVGVAGVARLRRR